MRFKRTRKVAWKASSSSSPGPTKAAAYGHDHGPVSRDECGKRLVIALRGEALDELGVGQACQGALVEKPVQEGDAQLFVVRWPSDQSLSVSSG